MWVPCGPPYRLLPTMVLFGLDMNLLPVMGGMGTSHTRHSNSCQPTLHVSCLRRQSVPLGSFRGQDCGEKILESLRTDSCVYLSHSSAETWRRWFTVHDDLLATGEARTSLRCHGSRTEGQQAVW